MPRTPPARRWQSHLAAASLLLVVALSAWAWLTAPPLTLVARLPAERSVEYRLDEDRESSQHWRILLRLDPGAANAHDWVLRSGPADAPDYELHWDHEGQVLRLRRILADHPLRAGSGVIPLTRLTLTQRPRAVILGCHADRLSLTADRETIELHDPIPTPATRRWHFIVDAEADFGRSSLAVHLDREQHWGSEDTLSATARRRLAAAIAAAAAPGEAKHDAVRAAIAALDGSQPAHPRLRCWYAWLTALSTLSADSGSDPAQALEVLAEADDPLSAGLLCDLLEPLIAQAAREPDAPQPARAWLQLRRERCVRIERLAARIAAAPAMLLPLEHHQLALFRHATACFTGAPREPTPTNVPAWVAVRWRLLGGIPIGPADNGDHAIALPPLPATTPHHCATRRALEAVLAANPIDAPELRNACAHIRSMVADRVSPALVIRAVRRLPPRERSLCTALLAFAGLVQSDAAAQALVAKIGGETPLRDRDALAYALSRLLEKRLPAENFFPRILPAVPDPREILPAALLPQRELLCGRLGATMLVFGGNRANLPPAQALTAALAMQEVAGLKPEDWNLLALLPKPHLPLELCQPAHP
ncbi:MAG: hypothetical protein ACOCZK_03050 [Planctomycetota bacterium]